MNRAWTETECIQHFKEQEPQIIERMNPGEKYKHCLDHEYLGGSCYEPIKVITSEGRVWGLRDHDFLDLERSLNKKGYKRTTVSESGKKYNPATWMTVHKLVANYFCDRSLMETMKAINDQRNEDYFDLSLDENFNYKIVQIHHINSIKLDNRASNLQYIYTEVHELLTALHNTENEHANAKEIARRKLEAAGVNNPDDPLLKIMLDNASSQGSRLYGTLIKDDSSPRGFRMGISMLHTIDGDPGYRFTEEEFIKMKIATNGTPLAKD